MARLAVLLSLVALLSTTYAAQKAQQDPKITSKVGKRAGGTYWLLSGSRSVLVLKGGL